MSTVTWENLAGTRRGFLEVIRMVSRGAAVEPLRWTVKCSKCGATWDETHYRLQNYPKCRYGECQARIEREAAQQARAANSPASKMPEPPEDPRHWDAYLKVLAVWEQQNRK